MTDDTPAGFIMQGHGTPMQHALMAQRDAAARSADLAVTQRILQQSLEQEVTQQLGDRCNTVLRTHCLTSRPVCIMIAP